MVGKANRNRMKRASEPQATTGAKQSAAAGVRFELPRPQVTEYGVVTVVPQSSDAVVSSPPSGSSGSPGSYEIVLVLGVPGVNSVATSVNVDQLISSGDSLLASEGLQLELLAVDGSLLAIAQLVPNDQKRLAQVRLTVHADDFAATEKHAHDAVMPVLSLLAFEADVAIEVTATVITEQATRAVRIGATLIGQVQPASEPRGWSTAELRQFLAIYREGLNSNMPLYQALCFYKILEAAGMFHRNRARAAAKAGTPAPPNPRCQTIPADPTDLPVMPEWSRCLFLPYLGKTFTEVDKAVKDTLRTAIAHLIPGVEPRVADRSDDIHACQAAVPVLRYVARQLIEHELQVAAGPIEPVSAKPVKFINIESSLPPADTP